VNCIENRFTISLHLACRLSLIIYCFWNCIYTYCVNRFYIWWRATKVWMCIVWISLSMNVCMCMNAGWMYYIHCHVVAEELDLDTFFANCFMYTVNLGNQSVQYFIIQLNRIWLNKDRSFVFWKNNPLKQITKV